MTANCSLRGEIKMPDVRSLKPRRKKDAHEGSLLSRVLSSASFAEKIEAIREYNPYFYLLTPLPQKEDMK